MTKWYYTEAYRAYAPLDAEIKELPTDDAIVKRVLVEDVAGFFCRLSGTYRDKKESIVVRWMHVEEQVFPVLREAKPADASKIVYREDMKELGLLVGAIDGEVHDKYAYCEPNQGIQTCRRACVKLDPPTDEQKRLQRWSQGGLGSCRHFGSVAAVSDCHAGCELPVLTPEIKEALEEGLDHKRTVTNIGDSLEESPSEAYSGMQTIKLDGPIVSLGESASEDFGKNLDEIQRLATESKFVRGPTGRVGDWIEAAKAAPDVENQATEIKWVEPKQSDIGRLARFCNLCDESFTYGILVDARYAPMGKPFVCGTANGNVEFDYCDVQRVESSVNPPDMKPQGVVKPSDLPKTLFGIPVVLGKFDTQIDDKMQLGPVSKDNDQIEFKSLKDSYQKPVKPLTAQAIQVAYARMKDRPKSATVTVPKEFAELVDELDDDDNGKTIFPDIAPEELAKVIADNKPEAVPLVDHVMCFDHVTGRLVMRIGGAKVTIAEKTSWLVAKNIAKLADRVIVSVGLPADGSRGF